MHPIFRTVFMVAALAAGSGTAQAVVPISYTLDTPSSGSSGSVGNVRTYTFGSGADAITLRMTGWYLDTKNTNRTSDDTVNASALGRWDAGFGVTSYGDSNGDNNLHAVDNKTNFDFIMLQFSKVVDLKSFVVSPFDIKGDSQTVYDSDVTVGFGTTLKAANASPFTGASVPVSQLNGLIPDLIANRTNYDTGLNVARLVTLNAGTNGNIFMIAARMGTRDVELDNFKVDQLTFTLPPPPAVPEPSTWAMMIFGFAMVGSAMRRKQPVVPALA